jgi:hypothetical protein
MRPVAFAKGEALSRGQKGNNGMAHGAEMTEIPPTTEPAAPSAAAERMRRHRQRRRDGLRCFIIALRETEIDVLIRKRLLKPETRNDTSAIFDALYAHLDSTLDQPS